MSKFVLTAQLKLQAPSNSKAVLRQVQSQLSGVKIPVSLQGGKQAQAQIQKITKATNQATAASNRLGKSFKLAVRRFAAFTVASRAVSLLTNSLASAASEAIAFERELVKISQVTQKSVRDLQGLQKTITELSTTLGVSSTALLQTGRILAQAGVRAGDLEVALTALAKTTLAPTFDDITQTAEGAVAILAQFGQGVGALERQLGAINRVAGQFAVESGDLISAVRRFGGVFKSAGGSLEDLLGLFTSVRATTRESAESIATGLRTIFTRIQRPRTIQFLKQFGVELLKADGRFKGPLEAVRELNKAFADLDQGDVRFIRVAEELGGFRQIGKVIPLIQQFTVAERARQAAIEGGNSLTKDTETAQQSLAVQIDKVRQEFLALVRTIVQNPVFQGFTKAALAFASALIKVTEALTPLLPLVGAFAGVAAGRALLGGGAALGAGLKGVLTKNQGGAIQKFASGGFVPGTGNRDTVPAMLTPGEFVIKKSSAAKLGAGTLQAMNENRFAIGGKVGAIGLFRTGAATEGSGTVNNKDLRKILRNNNQLAGDTSGNQKLIDQLFRGDKATKLAGADNKPFAGRLDSIIKRVAFGGNSSQKFTSISEIFPRELEDENSVDKFLERRLTSSFKRIIPRAGKKLGSNIGVSSASGRFDESILSTIPLNDTKGKLFQASLNTLGAPFVDEDKGQADFDFASGIGPKLGSYFKKLASLDLVDAKRTIGSKELKDIAERKTANTLASQINEDQQFIRLKREVQERTASGIDAASKRTQRRNSGGGISGSGDTVPALLTPGEFVVNKKAAQSIGYGNLSSMNKTGVARFNKGGTVGGIQTFQTGGQVAAGGGGANVAILLTALGAAQAAISKFGDTSLEASDDVAKLSIATEKVFASILQLVGIAIAVKAVLNWTKALKESQKQIEEGNKKEKKEESTNQQNRGTKDPLTAAQDLAIKRQDQSAAAEANLKNIKSQREDAQLTIAEFETGNAARASKFEAEGRLAGLSKADANLSQRGFALQEQQDARSLRIGALEQQKSILDQRGGRGTVADPNTQGLQLSSKDITRELEILRKEFDAGEKQAEAISSKYQQVFSDQEKYEQQLAEANQTLAGNNVTQEEYNAAKAKEAQLSQAEVQAQKSAEKAYNAKKAAEDKLLVATEKVEAELQAEIRAKQAEERQRSKAEKLLRAGTQNVKLAAKDTKAYVLQKKKEATQLIKNKLEGTKVQRASKALASGYNTLSKSIRNGKNRAKLFNREVLGLNKAFRVAGRGARSLGSRLKAGGGRAKAGIGKAAGALGGPAAIATGIVASVGAVANQIAAGFAEHFKRQEEIAKKNEDVAGAIEAAGKASQFESLGEIFSIESLFRGASDIFLGTNLSQQKAEDDLRKRQSAEANAGVEVAGAVVTSALRDLDQGKFRNEAGGTDFGRAASRSISGITKARSEVADLQGAERANLEAQLEAESAKLITSFANQGASLEELESIADSLGGTNLEAADRLRLLSKQLVIARERQKELNKANFDSLRITSAFGGAVTAVNSFVAGLQTGANSLASYAAELEAAQKQVGVDASASINAIENQLLASANAAGAGGSVVSGIRGQANIARLTNQFGVNAGTATAGLEISTDTETAKGQVTQALLDAIPSDADDATRRKLEQVINAQVGAIENIQTADLSKLVQDVVAGGAELSKGFLEAAKLQSQHNATMIQLYQQQEQLEQAAAEAKNKAIETQLEAAKEFEAFGGARLTGGQQLGARVAQFNNIGGLGGLGAQLTSGSAADIRQAQNVISGTFNAQQNAFRGNLAARSAAGGGAGLFEGPQGFSADKRDEAKRANEALITFTKQRISLLKEELSIVQKKNAEEKSALEKLISGDIEGFLEKQASAGAGAALRTGDAGLASLFSASALGGGFKSLEGQGLSDQQLRQAEDLTLQRFGLQGNGVLSGTTSQEEAIKSQGRELAGVLGDLAGDQAGFASAEFVVQEAIITATNATFQNKLREISERNDTNAAAAGVSQVQEFARGGTVYANRGMFVPRGTDTVPAMLTPGEFVVNRGAVQRGNNLQILRAMNSGGGASAPGRMNGGGQVRYYQNGGSVAPISSESITKLQGVFTSFNETVDKLINSQFSVKLDTTNVNVNFNGGSFLASLKDDIKSELLDEVKREIGKAKPNSSGDLKTGNTVLGN